MRMAAAAAAGVLLLSGAAPAQQLGAANGAAPFTTPRPQRPAPAEERPRARRPPRPAAAPGEDLFRARPWTYRPRHDRLRSGRVPRLFVPAGAVVWPYDAPSAAWPAAEARDEARDLPASSVHVHPDAQRPAPEPYIPGAPGPAKTLYVIRGCYAGDVLPQPAQLPAGCDAAGVRAVPPRER